MPAIPPLTYFTEGHNEEWTLWKHSDATHNKVISCLFRAFRVPHELMFLEELKFKK
jgi:hypothetical protein